MRINVLKTLDVLGVSKEEALEYIEILEQREQERKQRVYANTPLEVAYLKEDGLLEFFPYLILKRKDEIFGIKVKNCVWKINTSHKNISFYEASKSAKEQGCQLPVADDFSDLLYAENTRVNVLKTIEIFKENGIDIYLPDGHETFWTCQECSDGNHVKAVNMYERSVYMYDPTRRTAHAHFVRYTSD